MQYKFRLVIGPLTLADYQRFLPGGNNLPVLTELVCAFTGFEYCWEIELQLKPHAALRLLPVAHTSLAGPPGPVKPCTTTR